MSPSSATASFDIRQLRHAIAAADHGSFYRAARALAVEQSTLSRNILKLERSLGMPIFERSRAGVTLTVAGDSFIRSAKPMVATADRLAAMMRAAGQGRAGGLVLGHNSSLSAGNLRATTLSWHDANPSVVIECVEGDESALLAGIDTGDVDMAIMMGAADHEGFRREPLWSERLLAALPASHHLVGRQLVYWTDLRNECFHLPCADPGPKLRNVILGRVFGSGVTPTIKLHRVSRESILSVLGAEDGISIVSESAAGAQYPDVVYLPLHGEGGQAVAGFSGYWRNDNRNPALRRFLEFVKGRFALPIDIGESGERYCAYPLEADTLKEPRR